MSFEEKSYTFKTNVVGEHNILNLTSCIIYAMTEGFGFEEIKAAVADLSMVKRRQEVRGYVDKAIVIDDFAHHPRSVKFTIETIKTKYPEREVLVLMEPNSATARSSLFQKEFEEALSIADQLIMVKPPRPTSVKGYDNLDCQKIIQRVQSDGKFAEYVEQLDVLKDILIEKSKNEIVILVLSNGTCLDLWKSDFVERLSK